MHPTEIDRMSQLEERHWWFQGKQILVESFLGPLDIEGMSLDVGCGTGLMLQSLSKRGKACGIDVSEMAVNLCRRKTNAFLVRGTGSQIPFAEESFDLVTLLDIIEHTRDDAAVLKEAYRVCKTGGSVLVTVPAFSFLWGSHDVIHHHVKRYRRNELAALGAEAGFTVQRISYTNFFIFLPVLVRRVFSRATHSDESDLKEAPFWLNRFLTWLYRLEAAFLKNHDFPWGVSLLMLLNKPPLSTER